MRTHTRQNHRNMTHRKISSTLEATVLCVVAQCSHSSWTLQFNRYFRFASIREKNPEDLTLGTECLYPEVATSLPLTGPNLTSKGREMQFSTYRRKTQKWLSAKGPNHSSLCKTEKDGSVGSRNTWQSLPLQTGR